MTGLILILLVFAVVQFLGLLVLTASFSRLNEDFQQHRVVTDERCKVLERRSERTDASLFLANSTIQELLRRKQTHAAPHSPGDVHPFAPDAVLTHDDLKDWSDAA